MNSVLKLQNITKFFVQGQTKLEVLKNISTEFIQGNSYAIIGASGSGKSTLMHILAGIDLPSSGQVCFNNTDINKFTQKQKDVFLNKHIGFVFQESFLIQELTVLENIILKGLISGQSYNECKIHAQKLLEQFNLLDKSEVLPEQLSGGQKQRISILRAIFNRPDFLLADEPTGDLDEKTGKEITDFLLSCQKSWGLGLIISTHDKYIPSSVQNCLQLKNCVLNF